MEPRWDRDELTRRHGRVAAACAVALFCVASVAAGQPRWTHMSGPVTRAIDGDSIEVKIGDRLEVVRYAGISTPEIHHPTRGVELYRRAATSANSQLVADKHVLLMFDAEPRDRHGRLLAYVYVGNLFVNAELAGAGYAEVVTLPPNVQHREVFVARQREARQANRGLWADPEAVQYHRPRPAGVYGNTRLQIYFHPDDSGRKILLADPFVYFESPQHAIAAGYRASMDYATFVRREQRILSGEPLSVTTGGPVGGPVGGPAAAPVDRPRSRDTIYIGGERGTGYVPDPPESAYTRDGSYYGPYGPSGSHIRIIPRR